MEASSTKCEERWSEDNEAVQQLQVQGLIGVIEMFGAMAGGR
jgi:hypothetical protein